MTRSELGHTVGAIQMLLVVVMVSSYPRAACASVLINPYLPSPKPSSAQPSFLLVRVEVRIQKPLHIPSSIHFPAPVAPFLTP